MASDKQTPKPVDAGVLAGWKAKYAALGRLIEVYEEAARIGALGGVFDPIEANTIAGSSKAPMDLPVGVFRDKSLKEAIPLYLESGRRKQTNKEIAVGLQAGGFPTTADNFEATVATALYRLKNDGIILRFPDGWDVASSYPDSLRNRLEKDTKSKKVKKPKKAKRASKTNTERSQKTAQREPGLEQRIHAYLQTRGNEFTAVQELVSQLKVAAPVLNLTLGKMTKAEKIEKNQNGLVRLRKKAA